MMSASAPTLISPISPFAPMISAVAPVAELVEGFDETDVAFERRRSLEMKSDRELAGLLRVQSVIGAHQQHVATAFAATYCRQNAIRRSALVA